MAAIGQPRFVCPWGCSNPHREASSVVYAGAHGGWSRLLSYNGLVGTTLGIATLREDGRRIANVVKRYSGIDETVH